MEPCEICSSEGSAIALRRRASQFQNEDTCGKEVQIRPRVKRVNAPTGTESLQTPSKVAHTPSDTVTPSRRPDKDWRMKKWSSCASETSASAKDICTGNSPRLTKLFCPVCSVNKSSLVEHKHNADERYWECYNRHCLWCGQEGHGVKKCTMFRGIAGACRGCGVRYCLGSIVHPARTFGQNNCPIKKIISMALLVWNDTNMRQELRDAFQYLASVRTVEEFEKWIRGNENDSEADKVVEIEDPVYSWSLHGYLRMF